ncbi:MAG: ArsI/CadI family heavy metal resistance metalloenzyme [Cyanobacteria bacterium P01_A01_bin.114]
MAIFKAHVALRVSDLSRSIAFYQAFLDVEPVKHKVGYAKFELDNPGLNLTLNASEAAPVRGALSHLGIQVDSADALTHAIARLKSAGLTPSEEFNTDCCYALQDKAWVTDPDGNRWEIFVVHVADTAPELTLGAVPKQPKAPTSRTCCAPTCCA